MLVLKLAGAPASAGGEHVLLPPSVLNCFEAIQRTLTRAFKVYTKMASRLEPILQSPSTLYSKAVRSPRS